jgi:hypothetical protein
MPPTPDSNCKSVSISDTVSTSDTVTAQALPPRWQRIALTITTVVIFSTIAWCNLPAAAHQACYGWCEKNLPVQLAYRMRQGEWYARYAAHIGGVDNRWQMYGGQSRFNWEFHIYGEYGDEAERVNVLLPLPRQSERSLFTRWIVDFKEAKFYLNIYNDEIGRECYARYLARQYPEHQGKVLKNIRFDMQIRYILPPYVAVSKQKLFEDEYSTFTRDRFAVTNDALWAIASRQENGSSPSLQLTPASQWVQTPPPE